MTLLQKTVRLLPPLPPRRASLPLRTVDQAVKSLAPAQVLPVAAAAVEHEAETLEVHEDRLLPTARSRGKTVKVAEAAEEEPVAAVAVALEAVVAAANSTDTHRQPECE